MVDDNKPYDARLGSCSRTLQEFVLHVSVSLNEESRGRLDPNPDQQSDSDLILSQKIFERQQDLVLQMLNAGTAARTVTAINLQMAVT